MAKKPSSSRKRQQAAAGHDRAALSSSSSSSIEHRKRGGRRKKASEISLDRQLEVPLYLLAALLVCHALSGTGSLSLAHLSAHLPYSIQKLLPTWARTLPNLAPFASDVPNASHDSKSLFFGSGASSAAWADLAGPFRSEAAGFGHPLTALHTFTKACLGLSYPVREAAASTPDLHLVAPAEPVEPWAWLVGQPGILYSKGAKDILYVLTWILVWTALRAAVIRYILVPLGSRCVPHPPRAGRSALRARKLWEKSVMRFAEQGWCVVFYVASWSLGLHIARNSPYWLNSAGFWTGHPHVDLEGVVKFYYLTQCAYWFHMLIVINVEARRKDHWQMFSHHIITILLLVGSYRSHFTRVGNAILCLMDPSDILLSLAKCLRYMGMQTLCDVAFGVFMLSWIVTRHVLYCVLLWSSVKTIPRSLFDQARSMPLDGQVPQAVSVDWSPGLTGVIKQFYDEYQPAPTALVALLVALQFILLLWFAMIVRVAYKVVTGSGASDTRSSGEELSDEEEREVSRRERLGDDEEGGGKARARMAAAAKRFEADTVAASSSSVAATTSSSRPGTATSRPQANGRNGGSRGGPGKKRK